jgi:hypothetical protein
VLGVAAWQGLGSALGQALWRARVLAVAAQELGVAARHSPASKPVMAGVAAIAIAITAWWLMQPHGMVPPQVAGASAASSPPAVAPVVAVVPAVDRSPKPPAFALAPAQLAPAKQPPALEAGKFDEAGGFLAPMLKPALPRPTLMARLKPARKTAAPDRQEPPQPQLQKTAPLAALPPAKRTQEISDETRKRTDPRNFDKMLDQMFSDGLGH